MRLGSLALTSILLIPLVPARAQNTAAPSTEVLGTNIQTLHVTSREVVVDVMVTDAKGQPVHGLQQSNFTIFENGHPQTIRSFSEISSTVPKPGPTPPALPRGIYTNSQSTPATGPVDLLLLDALHTRDVANMARAVKAVSDFISAMPPGTKIAIFQLSESGLHMMQGFTSDPDTLLRSLHNGTTIEIDSNQEKHTTDWYTIDALNQIAAYVAGIKGRKNLLWITPGMPVNLMRDGGYGWSDGTDPGALFGGSLEGPDMGQVHRLMDVYERFTAEQVAVSPIDPRGVQAYQKPKSALAHLKVEAVAEQSGGEAFYNNNDLKSLISKAIDDQSHFYTLSYIPPNHTDDNRYHTVKVAVASNPDQPGLKLIYREGYNAERVPTLDAPAPGPELLKASMQGSTPARTQILFDVGLWPTPPEPLTGAQPAKLPKPKSGAPLRYDVHFGFPPREVAFLKDPDGTLHGSLQFEVSAFNVDRKLVAHLSQTVQLNFSPADYDDFVGRPYRFSQHIDLPPGDLSVHTGILDIVSSKVGTLEIPLVVPKLQTASPAK
ncbi:MAG: VWA domain-containing protein [Acidobacteriota bacterium]|nr:VWA domain-containing protein [Acidobacteriota bacterium]